MPAATKQKAADFLSPAPKKCLTPDKPLCSNDLSDDKDDINTARIAAVEKGQEERMEIMEVLLTPLPPDTTTYSSMVLCRDVKLSRWAKSH